MAILFEWYETPVPNNETDETEKTTIHARITLNGKVGTDEIRRKIQKRSSLTETDVSAVLDALSHVMGEELSEGRQVHLDGIGYFYPTLKSEKGITRETDRKNEKVRLKGIKFRADRALKDEVGNVKLKNFRHSGHSGKLSRNEISPQKTPFHTLCPMNKGTQRCGRVLQKSDAYQTYVICSHLKRSLPTDKVFCWNNHFSCFYPPNDRKEFPDRLPLSMLH